MLIQDVLKNKEVPALQQAATVFLQQQHPEKQEAWVGFCANLNPVKHYQGVKLDKTEKWWLCRTGLMCLVHSPDGLAQLAQFHHVALYLKALYGSEILRLVFGHEFPAEEYRFDDFATACHLLLDLFHNSDVYTQFRAFMPKLSDGVRYLKEAHHAHLLSMFPARDVDSVIARFQQDPVVKFPLSIEVLNALKVDYTAIQEQLKPLQHLSVEHLKINAAAVHSDVVLIAHMVELVRRFYHIYPHDTQLLAFLALIRSPEQKKGFIGQIKTGEGKSLIIAMLAGFMGKRGDFVDVITSSSYLAIRDSQKYQPFFEALGLTVSHICHDNPMPAHFSGQILYGTDKDFEFATLRDGLYHTGLRYSWRRGLLEPRTYDACINDEIDSLFLDMAFNSALLSVPRGEDRSSLYTPIYRFAEAFDFKNTSMPEALQALREHLGDKVGFFALSETQLKHYLTSARKAITSCHLKKDYVIKPMRQLTPQGEQEIDSIVIYDYVNTGRASEGSEWHHGLHQFLQVKHGLTITPEALTAASLAHPTYFGLYRRILGLTGTMGEAVEREEIRTIYGVETFDVPPFVPSLRKRLPSLLAAAETPQFEAIFTAFASMKAQNRPVLVLFETIKNTEEFLTFVNQKGHQAQILNGNQRTSEDYLVAKAGEAGMLTIATNVAGRGTDILLSPESIEAGGLHVIYGFYPDNIRVEEQGFGRGARQGQPGSGQMILNLQEERIQKLLSMNLLGQILLAQMLAILDTVETKVIEADTFVTQLDNLRSELLCVHSKARARCAQQEAVFFKKLQHFFGGLKAARHYFETTTQQALLIAHCQQFTASQTMDASLLLDTQELKTLATSARPLLDNQSQGNPVDWQGFLSQFKNASLKSLKKHWAQFYNQLHDEIGYGKTGSVQESVDSAYNKVKGRFESFLENPAGVFPKLLTEILSVAIQRSIMQDYPLNGFYGTNNRSKSTSDNSVTDNSLTINPQNTSAINQNV